MRRFVPFGTHWAMGIDVPYSFGVVDHGQFWSCGQCPIDLDANVRAPGDLEAQLRIVAGYICDQFTSHGVPPSRISKLVAYIVGDEADLAMTPRVLSEALGAAPLVIAVGVPHFYYPGMRVEIDVYGAAASAEGNFAHRMLTQMPQRAAPSHILAARLYVSSKGDRVDSARVWSDALGHDAGAAIHVELPSDTPALADIVEVPAATARSEIIDVGGIRLVKRQAGRYLTLLGRSTRANRPVPEQTKAIMEAQAQALRAEGLNFTDVVKQQTHYVGSSGAEDLYANMRIRNGYYTKPGPASTGLAVFGFADPATAITIELLAVCG